MTPIEHLKAEDENVNAESVATIGNEYVHVYPLFGRVHEVSIHCWCHPEHDAVNPLVLVHHVDN